MGHVYIRVRICDLYLSRCGETDLLVDTGSTYTWVSRDLLEEIGIKPEREVGFRTIEGRVVRRSVGMGIVEVLGMRAPTILVFAESGDASILGIHALEGLGLEVDPATRQLKRVEAVLAI